MRLESMNLDEYIGLRKKQRIAALGNFEGLEVRYANAFRREGVSEEHARRMAKDGLLSANWKDGKVCIYNLGRKGVAAVYQWADDGIEFNQR